MPFCGVFHCIVPVAMRVYGALPFYSPLAMLFPNWEKILGRGSFRLSLCWALSGSLGLRRVDLRPFSISWKCATNCQYKSVLAEVWLTKKKSSLRIDNEELYESSGFLSAQVFWCQSCRVPIITPPEQINGVNGKSVCPHCHSATTFLSTDLRPVFPEERLLLELLLAHNQPLKYS